MSITGSLLRGLSSLVTKSHRRDRIIDIMPNWGANNTAAFNQWGKQELIRHFTGWNYVAIKAIAEEMAKLSPCVAMKADGHEARSEYKKSLSRCRSYAERDALRDEYRKSFLPHHRRCKALAHLQESDELKPVSHDHPLSRLLRNPNGPDVSWTFWYKIAMYLELTGTSYIWAPPSKLDDKPRQMWVLPSHWVYEIPGEEKLIGSYEIRPSYALMPQEQSLFGAGWFPGVGGTSRIDEEQVIRIALPSPCSIVDGYAPVAAINTWIDVSNNIDRSRVATFKNAAFPGVALEMEKDVASPTPEEMERVKAEFAARYQGVINTGVPAILYPGIKIVPLTRTNVEMDYAASSDQMRGNLMAAHRVPQSIAGLVETSTFANAAAAKANFYDSCMTPKLMLIGQVMTEKLARRWDENLVVYWEDPAPNDPEMRLRKYDTMVRGMAATPNEWREAEGMPAWSHGGSDPIGNQMGAQPLGWATGEDPMANMQEQLMQQMGGGMPGMGGPMPQGQEQPQQGGDALDSVMGELLNKPGGDGANSGIPSAFGKRLNGYEAKANGNGVHHD